MIDYDNLPAEIDRLHSEAEDLSDLAAHVDDLDKATELRNRASVKVRTAARLRAQVDGVSA